MLELLVNVVYSGNCKEAVMGRFCQNCGMAVNDGDKFCHRCGTKLYDEQELAAIHEQAQQEMANV